MSDHEPWKLKEQGAHTPYWLQPFNAVTADRHLQLMRLFELEVVPRTSNGQSLPTENGQNG